MDITFARQPDYPGGKTQDTGGARMAGFGIATLSIALADRGLGALLMKTDNRVSQAVGAVLAAAGALMVS